MAGQTRSLTAIMFTDIVGYTSLMERDEATAIQVRERHRAIVRVLVEQFKGTLFLAPDEDEVMSRVLSEWLRISGDGPAVAGFFRALWETDTRELARRIEVPTLVIHGQEDRTVPLKLGRDLASLIPDARFEIVMGANHEQGAFFSPRTKELIAEFLAPRPSS